MSMAMGLRAGEDFMEAYDGQQALDVVTGFGNDNPFTMIIMDLSMPVMDGYDSSRAIMDHCSKHNMKTMPIIYAVTANERTPELEIKIKSYGMDSTQPKPLAFPILKMLLQKHGALK